MDSRDRSESEKEAVSHDSDLSSKQTVVKPSGDTSQADSDSESSMAIKFMEKSAWYKLFPFSHHRPRVSIRTQLIALVLFVAMFSLLTLAVVAGVYFSSVLKHTRATKLEVEAQLKAAQIEQGFNYYYYQVSLLSSRDTIQTALANRNAGNTSATVLDEARSTIQQFLDTTSMFDGARLYDPSMKAVANFTGAVPANVSDEEDYEDLYILSHLDGSQPPDTLSRDSGLIWGPIQQGSDYFASFTVPINTNSTFLVEERALGGYLTLVLNVTVLQQGSSTMISTSDSESARFFRPVSRLDNSSDVTGFRYVFQPDPSANNVNIDTIYPIEQYKPIEEVFLEDIPVGHVLNIRNPLGRKVSVGYASVSFTYGTWAVTLEQPQSNFMAPIDKLTRMMVGVCIGISALLCSITFMLAHYGVRPILRLQQATESVTEGRGLRPRGRRWKDRHGGDSGNKSKGKTLTSGSKSATPRLEVPRSTGGGSGTTATAVRPTGLYQSSSFSSNVLEGSPVTNLSGSAAGSATDDENRMRPIPAIVPTHGIFHDELTELTEAFNAMTEELDKQYGHLEDRVRARTKELEIAKLQADNARQQAESANEAKTVFIANISHELRTPLNGILGMTSIAMAEKSMTKIQSSLELIFRSGDLLLHILTQLLTFSKNQLDKSKLQNKNFVLLEVASQIQSIFGKTARDQDVDLVIHIRPDLSRKMILLGDSNRIIQVVMNLVGNSLKFTPENGTVKVVIKILGEYDEQRSRAAKYEHVYVKGLAEAPEDNPPHHPKALRRKTYSTDSSVSERSSMSEYSVATMSTESYETKLADSYDYDAESEVGKLYFDKEDDTFTQEPGTEEATRVQECYKFEEVKKHWVVRFSVSDTGTGIDDSLQEKIFEAFVQGDQTLSRSHGGTGLGLSICKQFAKLMNGTLRLTSSVGEGSTFTFTIPLPQVGELVVCPEKEAQFYEDDFNPRRPRSKKVAFADGDSTPDAISSSFFKPELITRASTGTARSRISNDSLKDSMGSPSSASFSSSTPSSTRVLTSFHNASSGFSSLSSTPSSPLSPTNPAGPQKRFLVAEDNQVNQEVVKRMMKLEGYSDVTLACDGFEAIDLIRQAQETRQPFDLVLMDVQMPKMDGITATRILRTELAYQGPIVALTAFADKSNEEVCTAVGMSGFLSKPVRRNLLRDIIKRFVGDGEAKPEATVVEDPLE